MTRLMLTLSVLAVAMYAAAAFADDPGEAPKPADTPAAEKPADKPADAPAVDQSAPPPTTSGGGGEAGEKSAEDVLNDLLKRRDENPLIEPTRPDTPKPKAAADKPAPAAVQGVNPTASPAQLKREGEFVITRRGRIVPATGGATGWMFAFESDATGLGDPPMFLMPCRLLEDMESMVEQHGDGSVFVVSGQVYVYHGANYLMPTLMKIAPSRGNLQP